MQAWFASIPESLKILVFLGSIQFILLLAYLSYRLVSFWISLDKLKLKDRFAIKNDVIKTAAQILGGAFFIAGLVFTYKNLVATQEKNVTDLYTKAIEQLGKPEIEVRQGGIYALGRIAQDSEKDHWLIMEILASYVRRHAPAPKVSSDSDVAEKQLKVKKMGSAALEREIKEPVLQAVLTVIGKRTRTFGKGENQRLNLREVDLSNFDLSGAHLEGADLNGAYLNGAILTGAHMEWALLNGARLEHAELQEVSLEDADLTDANLMFAHLERARLARANLRGAILANAELTGASLDGANLRGANLDGIIMLTGLTVRQVRHTRNLVLASLPAEILTELGLPQKHNQNLREANLSQYDLSGWDLTGTDFSLINLQGANLTGANLHFAKFYGAKMNNAVLTKADLKGADLTEAKGLTQKQLAAAIIDKDTKLPDYLKEPQPEKPESK